MREPVQRLQHRVAVRVTDEQGNYDGQQDELVSVGIDPVPMTAEVEIVSYDEVGDRLVLAIS